MNIEQLETELADMRMDYAETRGYLRRVRWMVEMFPVAVGLLNEAANYDFPDTDLAERICELLDMIEEYANVDSTEAS